MTPPVAPYVCAVCRAPVVAGARFCARCGTPFSERPPLRVTAAPSTPGAAVPPAARVPVVPPPPSYGPPPSAPTVLETRERSTAPVWIAGIVVLFVAALVGAYLMFAQPVDRDVSEEIVAHVEPPPGPRTPPPVSADEGLDDGSFPDDEEAFDAFGDDETFAEPDGDEPDGGVGEGDILNEENGVDDGAAQRREAARREAERRAAEQRAAEERTAAEREAERRAAERETDSPQMAAAWRAYQRALAAYQQAVRRAGSSDKSQAEVAAACAQLFDAGSAVLSLDGRERYAGQITRDRRNC